VLLSATEQEFDPRERLPQVKRANVVVAGALAALSMFVMAAPAGALSPLPGRIYALADVGGTRGDLFRTTQTNSWLRLTSGLNFPESVAASPDGRFAVICASSGGASPYRIYRVAAAGGGLRNLIGNRKGCGQTVSPDGAKVAYIGTGRASSNLNVVRSRGGGNRVLYRFCESCLYNPVWANGRIYFERKETRNVSADLEIYSVRARDGEDLRQHTNDRGAPIDYDLVDVSRNGRKLLVIERGPGGPAVHSLSIIGLSPSGASRSRRMLVSGPESIADASFSPSGDSIAYSRRMTSSDLSPYELWTGSLAPGSWSGLFSVPSLSTLGPYSIDWVRR